MRVMRRAGPRSGLMADRSKAMTVRPRGFAAPSPYPHDDRFAVRFLYDITNKPSGKRMTMDEVGVFTVANDKIVKEEFFYAMGG